MQISFADDSWEPPVQLIHKLKLLGEDGHPSKRAVRRACRSYKYSNETEIISLLAQKIGTLLTG